MKTSRHKPNVIATRSGLWAPVPDFFDLGHVHTWRLYFALKSTFLSDDVAGTSVKLEKVDR